MQTNHWKFPGSYHPYHLFTLTTDHCPCGNPHPAAWYSGSLRGTLEPRHAGGRPTLSAEHPGQQHGHTTTTTACRPSRLAANRAACHAKHQDWTIEAWEVWRSIKISGLPLSQGNSTVTPMQSVADSTQLTCCRPFLQRRALIFATGQSYSSLKRLVALKAQIQKHARTPNAIGATTGDTKFHTLAPALAYRLPRISSLAYWMSQTTRF